MRARDWKPAGGVYSLGAWRIDVHAKGSVDVRLPQTDDVDFTTEFVVAGDRLTAGTVPLCPGVRARYTWRATARKLKLATVGDDACAVRAALYAGTWRRSR
jgi:hypothetical protein